MRRAATLGMLVAVISLAVNDRCCGQAAWEYTPYQARLWLALAPAPQLPASIVPSLGERTRGRASAVMGAVMELEAAAAPEELRGLLLVDLENLLADQIVAVAKPDELNADKIYLAAVAPNQNLIAVRMREFDCRTRQLGPITEKRCATSGELPLALWDALVESFTPLARIEQVGEGSIVARLRAGGLATDDSPAVVEPGMVLRPVLRRNDRAGQPVKGGILPIGWTYFSVEERRGAVIECTQRSGYRSAIPSRGGMRLERLALLTKARHASTKLFLRSRTDVNKPLVGYEVHRRIENTNETALVGITDEQGAVELQGETGTVETYIIRSGRQLLARLPVVPGAEEQMTAHIVDDDPRVAAEGVVAALSSRALDLVARREILAARIRARLKDGKAEEAQQLLDEFRRLASRADLSRDLDRQRQQISSRDKVTQARIERVFNEGQKLLLLRPLSDELLAQLTREVAAARSGGGE